MKQDYLVKTTLCYTIEIDENADISKKDQAVDFIYLQAMENAMDFKYYLERNLTMKKV